LCRDRPRRLGLLLWLASPLPLPAQLPSGASPSVVDPGAALEQLFEGQFRTEGPSVALDGTIYFVDLDIARGGNIWRYDPQSKRASVFRNPSGVAVGTAIDPRGHLITAEVASGGGRRVALIELVSGRTTILAHHFDGSPLHGANDLALDSLGRVYFTEYALLRPGEVIYHGNSGVYRIEGNGNLERLVPDAGVPNGIAISPDQRTLYVGTNRFDVLGTTAVLAYDLLPEGTARFRTVILKLEASDPIPDGIKVDIDGNLYVALFSTRTRTGIGIYTSEGRPLGFIPTPGPATNLTFGLGPDATSLYVTAGTGLYRLPVKRAGYHPSWRTPSGPRSN